jgi:hypothetical protein
VELMISVAHLIHCYSVRSSRVNSSAKHASGGGGAQRCTSQNVPIISFFTDISEFPVTISDLNYDALRIRW